MSIYVHMDTRHCHYCCPLHSARPRLPQSHDVYTITIRCRSYLCSDTITRSYLCSNAITRSYYLCSDIPSADLIVTYATSKERTKIIHSHFICRYKNQSFVSLSHSFQLSIYKKHLLTHGTALVDQSSIYCPASDGS